MTARKGSLSSTATLNIGVLVVIMGCEWYEACLRLNGLGLLLMLHEWGLSWLNVYRNDVVGDGSACVGDGSVCDGDGWC